MFVGVFVVLVVLFFLLRVGALLSFEVLFLLLVALSVLSAVILFGIPLAPFEVVGVSCCGGLVEFMSFFGEVSLISLPSTLLCLGTYLSVS